MFNHNFIVILLPDLEIKLIMIQLLVLAKIGKGNID